jgi:very-short-patch-repair endonuclease
MTARGMLFALHQLNPTMRAQAEEKMKELGARPDAQIRNVIVPGPDAPRVVAWKETPRKKNSAPLLPQLRKNPKARLSFYLRAEGLGHFELEHKFHPVRKWRIDLAFVAEKLAIEIEGVTPEGGRHQRIAGFRNDIKKYNELTVMGWRLLRFMPEMVSSGYAVHHIKRALEGGATTGGEKGAGNVRQEDGPLRRPERGSRDRAEEAAPEARSARAANGARR